jgi:hypothetical protein
VSVGVVGAALGIAPAALAARVAVLVPTVESATKFTVGKKNKFHDTLTKGLEGEAGVSTTVIPADEVRQKLGNHTLLSDCQSGPCLSDVATKLNADRLIVARIGVKSAVGGSAYTIELSVFDQAGSPLPMNSSEKCGDDSDGCNLTRAYETLRRASANIAGLIVAEKAPKPQPPPVTPPPETQLKDPNAPDATQPPTRTAPPTAQPPSQSVDALIGQNGNSKTYNQSYRTGWIIALAAGTALTAAISAPFFYFHSMDGATNCGPTVPRTQCPQVYQGNLAPALGSFITGSVVTLGTFGVLLYFDLKEQRRARTPAFNVSSIRNAGDATGQPAGPL